MMGGIDVFQEGDDATYAAVSWLPLAYNYPGDDGRHFTRYNMVVAFRAGMMWANGDDIGVTPSEGGIKEAKAYLCNLLISFVQEHCDPVPEWAPLPDLMGMLTQIDNAVTIVRDIKAGHQTETERLRTALEGLDAYWTADFPEGPDGSRVALGGGFGEVSEDTMQVWRNVRAALSGSLGSYGKVA